MIRKHKGDTCLLARVLVVSFVCAGVIGAHSSSLAVAAPTTQWSVSGTGNDTSGCGSPGNPCRTISFVLTQAAAGGQINVTGEVTDSFTLDKNVVIVGAAGASLNGNGARVVTVNAGVTATLSGLTLRNGGGDGDGGLVNNAGTLIINNTVLTQTTITTAKGGAIYNSGTLTLTNSILSNNAAEQGGAIENEGMLSISLSTISNNQADSGGGIDNSFGGIVLLSRAVIAGNSAPSGAGLYNDLSSKMWVTDTAVISNTAQNWAGGILNLGQLSLLNSTLSGNRLPSGLGVALDHQAGSLTLQYVTVADNTVVNQANASAVNFAGAATIRNSVIANNGVDNCSGNAASSGYNISSDATCPFFNQPTDQNSVDARLGSVQSSGLAYTTFTHSPLQGSPLVNRIPPASCGVANDQRGTARPQNGSCDIGAYEVVPIDLGITAQASPASLPAGTPINIQLNVSNLSPNIASNVIVTSDVPADTVLSSCSNTATCVLAAGRLTVTLGTLNAGANASANFQLTPQMAGNLAWTFHASSAGWDDQLGNNDASINAVVSESADIKINLIGPQSVRIGAAFSMVVQVENSSAFAAAAPSFTMTLPVNVTYVGAHNNGWDCEENAGILTCNYSSQLSARSSAPVVIINLMSGDAPATIQFIGSVSSNTFDPDPTNNTTGKDVIIVTQFRTFIPNVSR